MTRKQWIVLVLLLVTALVPILSGGKKTAKVAPKKSHETAENIQSNGLNESADSESPDGALTGNALVAKADQALFKLSDLANLGPVAEKRSADDILKDTQILMPIATEERHSEAPMPTETPQPTMVPAETEAPISSQESESLPPEVPTTVPTVVSGNTSVEVEKLQVQIVSLVAKLSEQKRSFESRSNDLKSKLDIQTTENVKLSHQMQDEENNSADAKKLAAKIKDLEAKLDKSKADITEQKKLIDESKILRADFTKKIAEEQKIRKSIEDQLELAVAKRDEQSKDNEKLRRVVGDFEKRVKLIEEQRLAVSADKEQVLLKQLAEVRKELTTAQGALDDLKKKQKAQSTEVTSTTTKLEALQKQVENKQKENDDLSIKLATAERLNEKSKALQQELLGARNELMLAQEQVRTLMSTSKNPSADYQPRTYPRTETIEPPRTERPVTPNHTAQVPPTSDYLTIEVTAQKAALRAGPGEENSTVMEIQQGSKLMVETREGDWYRVITPKGQRAYLRADLAVELDASGRPRFAGPSAKSGAAAPRPVRPLNANPPDSDPLVELLGRQLKERQKNPPKDDSLNVDDGAAPAAAATPAANGEDEMEAFETLKQGMKKDTPEAKKP